MPNEVDPESVQKKRVLVSEWGVTSCQEAPNPASSCHYCLNSGEEFSSTKNMQTKVGGAMWSSCKQNKKHEALRSLQLHAALNVSF